MRVSYHNRAPLTMLTFVGCKKGGRECEFPQPTSSSKRAKPPEPRSPQDSSRTDSKDHLAQSLETIKDESDNEEAPPKSSRRPTLSNVRTHSAQSVSRKQKYRHTQEVSPTLRDRHSPQSTTSSSSRSRGETPASSLQTNAMSAEIQARQAKIKALKPDIQKFLQFQRDQMTHYHYFFKLDPYDFVHSEFIDQALSYEPLLYAAVGFAAYHYELKQPNAKLSHFLGYHSKALSMLRKSLESHTRYTEAMLLTVLQLATFEEYLGDWVNLVGHHRAAYTMLLQMFEPEPMMETELGRRIFSWYSRFDIIAGLMSGNVTQLDRVWFEANSNWYHSQVDDDPNNDLDVDGILADLVASNRLLGFDMAKLYSRLPRKEMTMDEFHKENDKIIDRLSDLKKRIEAINDDYYTVQYFPEAENRPLTDEDIVDPYAAGGLFRDALWNLNFMWMDWYSIEQMHKYQAATLLQRPISPELEALSLEQCRIYEAIDRWQDAPDGALLGCHASLGLTVVFLKKDEKHTMWCRQKLANIERMGYIFPPRFRSQMAQLWGLTKEQVGEENCVENWWLPNNEERPPILTEIRKVVQERHEHDDEKIIKGEKIDDVRSMRAIFARLVLRSSNGSECMEESPTTSDGARSAGSATPALNSPNSATSMSFNEQQPSAFEKKSGNQASEKTAKPSQRRRRSIAKEKDEDRMSGVWS